MNFLSNKIFIYLTPTVSVELRLNHGTIRVGACGTVPAARTTGGGGVTRDVTVTRVQGVPVVRVLCPVSVYAVQDDIAGGPGQRFPLPHCLLVYPATYREGMYHS